MMSGLMGSGAAGGAAAGGAASGSGGAAGGMGGGGIAELAGSGTMMGGGDSPGMQMFAQDIVNGTTHNIGQMPSAGGMQGGGQQSAPLVNAQAAAPGHNNDPLMQGGGMWQKIFGGGI